MIDHLIYGTPHLERGVAELEDKLGVRATPGGRHPGRGTHNALLSLGPSCYLEIMAPDPEAPPPPTPRWLGLDELDHSTLVAWAARHDGHDLERFRRAAVTRGVPLGAVAAGSRKRPDGVTLSWKLTDPDVVIADRIVPFFIAWEAGRHPALDAAPGASLLELRACHPDPAGVRRALAILGLDRDLTVEPAALPRLTALIAGRRGTVELGS